MVLSYELFWLICCRILQLNLGWIYIGVYLGVEIPDLHFLCLLFLLVLH